jgi:fumarate hydratase, class II
MEFRTEHDTMGSIQVPIDRYWGAQTERSLENFKIGSPASMPIEVIHAFAILKKAAAMTNHELHVLDKEKMKLISKVCDEIQNGLLDDHFPLVIWQTGSGTQTNMNVNEVISNRAQILHGGNLLDTNKFIHPNDDVNRSQSSNDTFPTAVHIAVYKIIVEKTIKGIEKLRDALHEKSMAFADIVKTGRTHLMDATPLTLGQEFSGYVSQLDHGLKALKNTLAHLSEIALGGTAVGTGINTPKDYCKSVAANIAKLSGLPIKSAENKFEALSSNDALVEVSSALKQLAISLMQIGNNIRLLASGPRCGINEISLPANEPGSSIMPGKVNPTQNEALTMVCAQVIGNDLAITIGSMQGHFQLNTFRPMVAHNLIESANLLGDACVSFATNAVEGIVANKDRINELMSNSLMLVTALNPHIGYENAAKIAKLAYAQNISLREAAISTGLVTPEQFDEWVNPKKMI